MGFMINVMVSAMINFMAGAITAVMMGHIMGVITWWVSLRCHDRRYFGRSHSGYHPSFFFHGYS